MPAFTAVGAYVAGTIFGLVGTAAVVVGAIVATGAAYITSRIINGNPNKGGNASSASQGGRIQVPPATNNKIPVLYGDAYVNGIITDARLISTDQKTNNTMFYCIVLSETCNDVTATYDVNNIYWNDLRLTQVDSTTNAHKIKDGRKNVDNPDTSIEDFVDTNFIVDGQSLVEVRVYAGSSAANKQIFPTQASTNTQAAYDFWGNDDNSWTTSFAMTGLVFAIVKVTYNGEKGFTALPNMTFDISNSVSNPADVWLDYMTGVRYGAGIPVGDIDTTATTAWKNFCAEDISYTNKDGTTNQATDRYKINGLLDTTRSVKENIDIVLQNGGAWMSYDVATGLWSPVIKKAITAGDPTVSASHFTASRSGTTLTVTTFPEGRIEPGQELYNTAGTLIGTISAQLTPLTAGETAGQKGRYTTSTTGTITTTTFYTTAPGLLSFSDDNIISGISISSTRLDDLYNSVEAEFYDQYNKDQKAYARNKIDAGERNPNEPDNQLRMSLDLCNNSMQADILGQMELRQSRDDLVIEFTSNHYGIQTQAGDIVNVYSELYDWAPKLFRVMRVKEQETEEGGLVAQIQAMEYNGDVYTIEPITEFTTEENIGIGVYGASPNLPLPPDVVIATIDADAPIPNFQLQVTIPSSGGPFDEIELYYTEGWDQHPITGSIVPGTGSNGAAVGQGLLTVTATTYGNINPGDRIDLLAPTTDIFIVSQLTNTPASKTFVSGGVPGSSTSTLLTLNNVTGLIVGNTLTGTGIPNGSFIIEIDAGTNTVRIENAVTAQAAGTYIVSGGLGTYIVDVSTTISGTADLYDFPETDNYKLLKKLTPEGNNPTFTNGTVVTDVITNVPANSATYRRWFVIARMGIKKRFGAFSVPGDVDFEQGRFPYNPNPAGGGGGGGALPGVFSSVDINNTTPWLTFSTQPDGVNPKHGVRGRSTQDDYWFVGGASAGDDLGYLELATADNAGGANNGGEIYVRQYNGAGAGGPEWVGGPGTAQRTLTLLDNLGNTSIPQTLTINNGTVLTNSGNVSLFNTNATTVDAFAVSTTTNIGSTVSGSTNIGYKANIANDLTVNNGTVLTNSGNVFLFNTNATTVDAFAAATQVNFGINGDGQVDILPTRESTSPSTGALQVSGGVGIVKKLHVGGTVSVDDTLDSTSPTSGSIQTDGGIGIVKKLHVGGTVSVDDTLNATSTTSGSIQTDGGVAVAKDIFVGGSGNIEISLTVPIITTLTGDDLNISAFSGRDINITATNGANGGGLTLTATTCSDPVTIVTNTANTNTSTRSLTLRTNSTGTPATGFGSSVQFEIENASTVIKEAAFIDVTSTNITSGAENFVMDFGLMENGSAYSSKMQLDSAGDLSIKGTELVLNSDGAGAENITITFERGATDAAIIWREGDDTFKLTNNTEVETNLTVGNDLTVLGNDIIQPTTGTVRNIITSTFYTQYSNSLYYDPTTFTTIDSWDGSVYRSAKYILNIENSASGNQVLECLVLGTGTPYITVYADVFDNINTIVLTAIINPFVANEVLLRAYALLPPATSGGITRITGHRILFAHAT